MSESGSYHGPAFFSYGFRPFFFCAALFAGIAVPVWMMILSGAEDIEFLYAPREWHVHEMVFGFLPCVITGFLLTAIPNWTDRPPIRGLSLILLLTLWLAGRLAFATPLITPLAAAIVDGVFLVVVAGIVWREIAVGHAWDRLPMGVLISLYAGANILFHTLQLNHSEPDLAYRMALTLIMILLTLIGGRITPGFTEDYFGQEGITNQLPPFSHFDGVSIAFVAIAAFAWTVQPQNIYTGWALLIAGFANVVRLLRWHGWATWREPLVLILHVGYGWLAISLLILGGTILGIGLPTEDAIHSLTTGAVGTMTLAVMTRATLGHTGHTKHAGPMTILIYLLVTLGSLARVFGPSMNIPDYALLNLAAACWSGAYLLFAIIYGPTLFRTSLEEQ